MTSPLWIPWLLALSLLLPVALVAVALRGGPAAPGRSLTLWLLPGTVVALVAASQTLDRVRISGVEVERAATRAARLLDGTYGYVSGEQIGRLIEEDLPGVVVSSPRRTSDAVDAPVSFEVGPEGDRPLVCVTVAYTSLVPEAPELVRAAVTTAPGAC